MIVIITISIILYLISGTIIYHITKLEKDEKVRYILIGMFTILIVTFILCSITSSQIDNIKKLVNVTRNTAVLIFSPLNSIILAPVGYQIGVLKNNEIKKDDFKKRMVIISIIASIVLIIEFGYIKNFQIGLLANVNK